MRRSIPLLAAVVLAALAGPAVPKTSARDLGRPLVVVEGAKERHARAVEDAKALVRTRFPSVDDVGPGWRRPWERDRRLPLSYSSEKRFWDSVEPAGLWGQYFGLGREEAETLLRAATAAFLEQAAAEPPPPDMPDSLYRMFSTERGLLTYQLFQARLLNMFSIEGRYLTPLRMQDAGLEVARQKAELLARHRREEAEDDGPEVRERHARERAEQNAALATFLVDRFAPDAPDLEIEALYDELLRELGTIRRSGEMHYIHIDPETIDDPRPQFGVIAVSLRILDPEEIEDRVTDVDEAGAKRVEAELNSLLGRITAEVAKASPGGGAGIPVPTVTVEPVPYGDNAFVLTASISGVPALADFAPVMARLRNGVAVVNLSAAGTRSREWMREQIGWFLAAMEERTEIYRED